MWGDDPIPMPVGIGFILQRGGGGPLTCIWVCKLTGELRYFNSYSAGNTALYCAAVGSCFLSIFKNAVTAVISLIKVASLPCLLLVLGFSTLHFWTCKGKK